MNRVIFSHFANETRADSGLRAAISAAGHASEPDCVARLLPLARLPPAEAAAAQALAARLATTLRAKRTISPVAQLVREYDLSTAEGIALMCLAEALLRIPDRATRDALIRDKIAGGDWQAHLGHSPSLFVNAATWGLSITGKITGAATAPGGLTTVLTRLLGRSGAPVIAKAVDLAMRMMGEQFVTGQTIAAALANSKRLEAQGFTYSYDMLGEAAMSAGDAAAYYAAYEGAIHAIGAAAAGRGIFKGPGISIKLSALHPRYTRGQRPRVMAELMPRVAALAALARSYDIGLNIDAEEASRLDLSLDLLETLCADPALAGWDGLGFVVQAYQKRAVCVVDFIIDLARRSGRRLMVRLVKGAYWDSEIKRAQVDGLAGFPVFTRKAHTDVSYLACAKSLLAARHFVFPQFATHNAATLAAIHEMAGGMAAGQYEFQCLHGMGEPLYEEVVGTAKLNVPCRIYAPVGTHETLLAYLVRRLLENGANSSFVNRIQDLSIPVSALVADPVAEIGNQVPAGQPHEGIKAPTDLFAPSRVNAEGLDLHDEAALHALSRALLATAAPATAPASGAKAIRNPADHRDIIGWVVETTPLAIETALAEGVAAFPAWAATPPAARAACLLRAAQDLETRRPEFINLLVREAGKTLPNAISEIREAVDFLRYYAAAGEDGGIDNATHHPLGPVVCISPWNFPLAIFLGQVAASLIAGNTVLAKPAPETPLIAAAAVTVLHEAGVPPHALQCLPGAGAVGAALVADPRCRSVLFTGSFGVAKQIQRQLAARVNPDGTPVPLIAETGGQNVMVVDSSALPEQVVADVLTSAFDSAGQRCSALRILALQTDAAPRILPMLLGAMRELAIGSPDRLETDIGPVITPAARDRIDAHIAALRACGRKVHQTALPDHCRHGTFIAPTVIEIETLQDLSGEVFGPVLHVLRFKREGLDDLIAAVNALGYGLTFGIHSRIDETINRVIARISVGNIYVNRNMVGAVVGVQPFGGHDLSGTGPKAGGPLYVRRLFAACPALPSAALPVPITLPGPVGERNTYHAAPRGVVLCVASDETERARQRAVVAVTGNQAITEMPSDLGTAAIDAVLFEGDPETLMDLQQKLAARPGSIVPVFCARPDGTYPNEWLSRETAISVNTAAAGGNAHLMMMDAAQTHTSDP